MKNHSLLTHIFFFCLFFLFYHITISTSTPPYIAVENITLNCGTSDNSTAPDLRLWVGDIGSNFGPAEEPNHKSNISQAHIQSSSIDAVPYLTARLSYFQFTYVFPVTPGPKFVRLYFYSAPYSGFDKSKDFFTVKAGSFTLLQNFSASILVNPLENKNFVKEFCINVDKHQKLNLTFIPTSSNYYAFVNGIEIVSMPLYLYYRPQDLPLDLYYRAQGYKREVPLHVGQAPPQFFINYSMALEKVYRLNMGGALITPFEDTGMFREWSDGIQYMSSDHGVKRVIPRDPSLMPNYSKIPNYIAPVAVYQSAISMGLDTSKNRVSNLTWRLPVDTGFNYLVRLHFCEIVSEIFLVGTRVFTIYIDYQLAEERADVISWAESNATPIFKDYVVMIKNKSGEDMHLLSIDLHPITEENKNLDAFLIHDAILNGVEVFKLSNPDGNLARPNNVAPSLLDQQPEPAVIKSKTIFIAIGSGVGFLLVLILVCCMVVWKLRKTRRYGSCHPVPKRWWCWPNPYKRKLTRTKLPEVLCRYFTLDELKQATNNFNKELIIGVGGFGNVYMGLIDNGNMTVAIKRMKPESRQGAREFRTEIEMLSQLRHVHLVSLIGYCYDDSEMILVYEYMKNGTLCHHLYDTDNDPLTWKQRLQICIGAARGLHYLHTSTKHPIIHRDVKTTNILLDEKWVSKVSDFGLSKMGLDNSAVSTLVKGTVGYLDPDYARRQQLTEKSDVYSFGVVMFEVLCARKAMNQRLQEEQRNLASWARKCIERGTISQIIDPYLSNKMVPECLNVYVELAESCIRDQGIHRPTMNDVMEKLEFALELQENVDKAKDTNSEEESLIHLAVTSTPWYNNVYNGKVLASTSGTELTTISSGLNYPGLNSVSISITSQDVSMNTITSEG
uniref:Protein kinase domain-containing protein n=1 Tax=Fagus sylvatica TaxID=28930 RepID=A0A2N9INN4_FAGSY